MKILIDTHILLWAFAEPNRIAKRKREEIESPANTVYVSAVSVAEIAIKASIGKLTIAFDPVEEAARCGFDLLDFTAHDALRLREMPFHHRDPFDRMLIAQSLTTGMPLLTDDPKFKQYGCKML